MDIDDEDKIPIKKFGKYGQTKKGLKKKPLLGTKKHEKDEDYENCDRFQEIEYDFYDKGCAGHYKPVKNHKRGRGGDRGTAMKRMKSVNRPFSGEWSITDVEPNEHQGLSDAMETHLDNNNVHESTTCSSARGGSRSRGHIKKKNKSAKKTRSLEWYIPGVPQNLELFGSGNKGHKNEIQQIDIDFKIQTGETGRFIIEKEFDPHQESTLTDYQKRGIIKNDTEKIMKHITLLKNGKKFLEVVPISMYGDYMCWANDGEWDKFKKCPIKTLMQLIKKLDYWIFGSTIMSRPKKV